MRVALTGSTGFVGRTILSSQHFEDFEVVPSGGRDAVDLRNLTEVERWLRQIRPDVVVHAAGLVGGIQANVHNNAAALVVNTQLGFNVMNASRSQSVPRVLNLASSCMYPKDHGGLLKESDLLNGELEPTNEGYALAKLSVMKLGTFLSEECDGQFAARTLIPCNLYGPFDSFTPGRSHLVASTLYKAHMNQAEGVPIQIWGDGTARREFMYADDLVFALARALEIFDELPAVTNVGTGKDLSVRQYYEAACRVVGVPERFTFELSAPTGMRRKVMDVSAARAFGMLSETSLDTGLSATYEWWSRGGFQQ